MRIKQETSDEEIVNFFAPQTQEEVVPLQPVKEVTKVTRIISDDDVKAYAGYLKKSNGVIPKEFFTASTTFKEFYNPATGRREKAPQSSKWLLQDNGLYNLVDKDSGEIYITDVNLKTGMKTVSETSQPITETTEVTEKPKGMKVKEGVYVNQEALTKDEQLELFDYLKPFLEDQSSKTNKGVNASKMIGLGLRWDYKANNPGKQNMNIPDVINPRNKNTYGYYNTSINDQSLAPITPRFRELMQKATGVDMTNYDGAIINVYDNESFISSHNDVDESRSAINYPVIGINIGGTGNFSIESRDGSPQQLNLKAGSGYVFGLDGVNREVYHRTFAGKQDSFLPELTTKLDGKTYEPGSYRVTVTMRRVMPLEPGMPAKPAITSTEAVSEKPEEKIKVDNSTLKDGDIVYDKLGTKFIFRGLRQADQSGAGSPRLERTDGTGEIAIPGVNIELFKESTIKPEEITQEEWDALSQEEKNKINEC
jgi:alkylated DNA repair dioxygenase AlkB